jgi:hypothetical protein
MPDLSITNMSASKRIISIISRVRDRNKKIRAFVNFRPLATMEFGK